MHARLEHRHIIALHGVMHGPLHLFLRMEEASKGNLFVKLKAVAGALPVEDRWVVRPRCGRLGPALSEGVGGRLRLCSPEAGRRGGGSPPNKKSDLRLVHGAAQVLQRYWVPGWYCIGMVSHWDYTLLLHWCCIGTRLVMHLCFNSSALALHG